MRRFGGVCEAIRARAAGFLPLGFDEGLANMMRVRRYLDASRRPIAELSLASPSLSALATDRVHYGSALLALAARGMLGRSTGTSKLLKSKLGGGGVVEDFNRFANPQAKDISFR
jgi:hypothetical protein